MFGQTRLFKRYLEDNWHDLYRVAYVWTNDREIAADLVQETITRCLKNIQKFEGEKDLRCWLFKVLSNCRYDHFRRQKKNIDVDDVELYSTTDLESEHYRQQIINRVNEAFGILKSEHREILSLVIIEKMSYEDISKVLGIPIGTVMSRVSRGRSKLKEQMKDVDLNDELTTNVWRIK